MHGSPRVLLAGIGPGGDQAGAVQLARALRDTGWEVVHLGEVAHPDSVAAVARDEDADAVVVLATDAADTPQAADDVVGALAAVGRGGVTVLDASGGVDAVVTALGQVLDGD